MSRPRSSLREMSGVISTQNLVPAGVATPNSSVELDVFDLSTLSIQTVGTYTGALSLQATINGTNWVTVGGLCLLRTSTGAVSATIASGVQDIFEADVSSFKKVRISALAATTGSVAVSLKGDETGSAMWINAPLPAGSNSLGVVDTELPAAVALADALANPTSPIAGLAQLLFNGTTWDRVRNNWVVAAESSSAKGASGNSAGSITNWNARGAEFIINVTAVSGTSPTLTVKLQVNDIVSGKWVDVPGAVTASITAVSTVRLQVYPGVTEEANSKVSYALPRIYRFAWTIGGTSPSFTFSIGAHYVN